jgi:hypothetical protein
MGENIAEAGSNKGICRGSTAYRIFLLTSVPTASYNNINSTTKPAEKQEENGINLYDLTSCAMLLIGLARQGIMRGASLSSFFG